MEHDKRHDMSRQQSLTSPSEHGPLSPESYSAPTRSESEAEWVDKWFQRITTYAGLPGGIMFLIYNQTYLAVVCFVWLTVAVTYTFYRGQMKRGAEEVQRLGLGGLGPRYKPLPIGEAQKTAEAQPAPNIVCLPEDRLDFVELDRHQVFRESDYHEEGALRAVAAAFTNAPKPPHKVGEASKVSAQIEFYDAVWPDRVMYRVNHACWLNEESPYVSFDLGKVQHVIMGVFQHKKDGGDGFEPDFTIYGNSPDRNAPLTTYPDRFTENFKIKVRLIVGEHGEFSAEYDFELHHTPGQGFSNGYVSEEEKQLRRAYFNDELVKLIAKGEAFVTTPLIEPDWDTLYQDIHKWRNDVSTFIHQQRGRPLMHRFLNDAEQTPYPHKIHEGRRRFFDELYTRIENLKGIAREEGADVPATDVAKQIEEVTKKRREKIAEDLEEFAAEARSLIDEVENQVRYLSSEQIRKLYIWDVEIFDYLSEYLDRAAADALSNDAAIDSLPDERQQFITRVRRRLEHIARLTDDVRSGSRAM